MEYDRFDDPNIIEYKRIPASKRFSKTFRALDLYSIPITLRYKSDKHFVTNIGASISLGVVVIMFAYLGMSIATMLGKSEITTTSVVDFSADRPNTGTAANMTLGCRIVNSS